MASNSLSCTAKTALMSRFGVDDVFWAMFCLQAKKGASETTTKHTPTRRQNLRPDCIVQKLDPKKSAHACRRMFQDVSFASAMLLSHHAGTEKREHLVNWIRKNSRAVTGKEQTNGARINRHVLDEQRS